MNTKCPICGSPANEDQHSGGADKYLIDCFRCGRYHITGTAKVNVGYKLGDNKAQIAALSSWIRENQEVEFDSRSWDRLPPITPPSLGEKADKLLKFLANEHRYPGKTFSIPAAPRGTPILNAIENDTIYELPAEYHSDAQELMKLLSISWSYDFDELEYLFVTYLDKETDSFQIRGDPKKYHITITPKGWAYLESLKYSNIDSPIAFVAMWFNNDTQSLFDNAIYPGIRKAGYEPLRIDQKDFINRIDDEIIASIRQSRFVVADYTEQRGGVYFESGFALGLGLPVIYLCKENQLDKLHFDVEHYPFLLWKPDELEGLRKKLAQRILAIVGKGPL